MCPLKLSLPPFLTAAPFCGFLILKLELIRHELFTKWFILLHGSIFLPPIDYLSSTHIVFTINVSTLVPQLLLLKKVDYCFNAIVAVWPLHNGSTYWYFLPNDYPCKRWFLIALLCSVLTPYLNFLIIILVVLCQMFGKDHAKRIIFSSFVQEGWQIKCSLSPPPSPFLCYKYCNYVGRIPRWWVFPVLKALLKTNLIET